MSISSLLAPWKGSYGGVPPFDQVVVKDLGPALVRGMAQMRAELDAITRNPEPPTFANTIEAFENAGRAFQRVSAVFHTFTAAMNTARMQKLEADMAPRLAAFADELTQNAALFARIEAVHEARDRSNLDPEQRRLVETHYRSFARRGAALPRRHKQRLSRVNQELARLYTRFSQNLLADESDQRVLLRSEEELSGLPASVVAAMKASAEEHGERGWAVANTRSAAEPFLVYSTRRDLRERVWRMWNRRGDHPGPRDNKPLITKILALRAERARLLGCASHAHWMIADNMAATPEAARALMMKVWEAAAARVREEVEDMARLAGHRIEPWDYRFYAEAIRKARYDLDGDELKAYLQLDRLRDAMFWAANRLHGLQFTRTDRVPVYHPDVTVYEVTRGEALVGLWYFDPYARAGKRSGAWMSEYRTQERFASAVAPIVSNNANFVKGEPGEPVLISWDDAVTLFHEFGHALHGLLSDVRYPSLAGTNTKRDFVEFPSQLNERWLTTPEVLRRFCRHHRTGAPIPRPLVKKLERARNFNQGFRTVEYLLAALYDLDVHLAAARAPIDPAAFERRTTRRLRAPREVVMRHRPPAFAHIFSDDGYSAGYYSYIWADTLTADAARAFEESGSYYHPPTARRLRDHVMRVGNAVPPEQAFRAFRGRDVDTDALMRERGFSG